jgi:hypothetical protein
MTSHRTQKSERKQKQYLFTIVMPLLDNGCRPVDVGLGRVP